MDKKPNEFTVEQILTPLTDEQLNSLNRSELLAIAEDIQKLVEI